jgi:tRNA modification GTPase
MGVARALSALEDAAVVLWVVDGSRPLADDGGLLAAGLVGRRVVVVLTKCDLGTVVDPESFASVVGAGTPVVRVSSTTGEGLDALRDALATVLGADRAGGLAGAVSNPRHTDALERARAALGRASDVAADGAPGEIVAMELREALAALGEVTGRDASEDLLERVFSRFCIGK